MPVSYVGNVKELDQLDDFLDIGQAPPANTLLVTLQ
jgi:hypothetical protein